MLLSILAHIYADERFRISEKPLSKTFHEMRLTHARRTYEEESANGTVVSFETYTVADDGAREFGDCLVLCNDFAAQGFGKSLESLVLVLRHFIGGHTTHQRNHTCNIVGRYFFGIGLLAFLPFARHAFKLFCHLGHFVAKIGSKLVVLVTGCSEFAVARFVDQSLLLFQFFRSVERFKVLTATGFVKRIYSLVGKGTVGDITCGKRHAVVQRFVGILHVVVLLVAVLDIFKNLIGLLGSCWFKHHFLEAAVKRTVLFYCLFEFGDGSSTYALNLAAGKSGLEDIGSIERTCGRTGSDDCMDFIHKKNDLGMGLDFFHKAAQTFFKLTTVLRASHNGSHVKRNDALVLQ